MRRLSDPYNRLAGQSLDRLSALSDGIFAVAMTCGSSRSMVPPRSIAVFLLIQLNDALAPRRAAPRLVGPGASRLRRSLTSAPA